MPLEFVARIIPKIADTLEGQITRVSSVRNSSAKLATIEKPSNVSLVREASTAVSVTAIAEIALRVQLHQTRQLHNARVAGLELIKTTEARPNASPFQPEVMQTEMPTLATNYVKEILSL